MTTRIVILTILRGARIVTIVPTIRRP